MSYNVPVKPVRRTVPAREQNYRFPIGITIAIIIIILLNILYRINAKANGGPYDESFITATGNIHLIKQDQISLESKLLWIEVDGDYANVQVLYQFSNHGETQKVTYAFPVDYLGKKMGLKCN